MEKSLNLTHEWDKVFPLSNKVNHRKVTFTNRYGITLAADMYVPKQAEGKLPAIAVSGPFGAVKEQSSGLYAMTLAERGFLTIAFDPSYTGESGGEPRYVASPDINTEDFCAAVDFLSICEQVDADRIGILGICGWGGMALNAAAIDTRIKATVTATMYDMSRVNANGYFDAMDADARYELRKQLNAQRTEDYRKAPMLKAMGVPYVIIGHSERRQYFGETNETVNKRVRAALDNGLKVILCVGEVLEEREQGVTFEVVGMQTKIALQGVSEEELKNVIIAYEPVWAIGTGKTATADQADEVNGYIRSVIAQLYGQAAADAFVVQYGGSMNAGNAEELLAKEHVDGGLIGGASLKAKDFSVIVKAASK